MRDKTDHGPRPRRRISVDITDQINSSNIKPQLSSSSSDCIINKKHKAPLALFVFFCVRAIISEKLLSTKNLPTLDKNDYISESRLEEWELDLPKPDNVPAKDIGNAADEEGDGDPEVFFVGSDMADQRCWILVNSTRLLECGMDGMIFTAKMECSDSKNRMIAMKVPILYNKSANPPITFRTDTKKTSLEHSEQIYDALYKNTTTRIRQYFAIAVGSVSMSPDLLLKAVEAHKRSPKSNPTWFCYKILMPSPSSPTSNSSTSYDLNKSNVDTAPVIAATVTELAKGSRLKPQELSSLDERLRVASDFVCIYQHQHDRKFIHADILNHYHFYDDRNHVTLVDFSRVLFPNSRNMEVLQKMQLFQLVALLGNICAQSTTKFEVPDATRAKDIDIFTSMRQKLSFALEPCKLLKRPLSLPLFSGHGLSTEQTYQILSNLTGGCRDKDKNK